jgi:CheY-like chemotaxis protein
VLFFEIASLKSEAKFKRTFFYYICFMDKENEMIQEMETTQAVVEPVVQDYTSRKILLWEDDESRRQSALEFLSDLLTGAEIQTVASENEALEALDLDDWDTFVVDFMNEGVSDSEFVKRANNYPAAIVVAISLGFLELEERDPLKQEQIRRLFDIEKATAPIRAS